MYVVKQNYGAYTSDSDGGKIGITHVVIKDNDRIVNANIVAFCFDWNSANLIARSLNLASAIKELV